MCVCVVSGPVCVCALHFVFVPGPVCVCVCSIYGAPMNSSENVVISQCCLTLPGPIVIVSNSNLPNAISTSS